MSRTTLGYRQWERAGMKQGAASRTRRSKGRWCSRPLLELLEERALLSVDMVTTSHDSGQGSLRDTIASAAAGDTIQFDTSPGHVTSPITLTSGLLDIAKNLDIEGPASGQLAISGNKNSRIFSVESGVTASISFLTMTDGNQSNDYGGAVYNNNGKLTLTSCVISNNTSSNYGGGLYNAGSATLDSCTFSNNKSAGYGGAIANYGTANLTNCTLSQNSSGSSYWGGGIYNSGSLNVASSTLSNNTAYYGAGIYNVSSATIVSSTFSTNTAGYAGGALFNANNPVPRGKFTVVMTNCTVTGNSAQYGGGV